MSESLLTVNEGAATPPKPTVVAPLNPAPRMSTVFPPTAGPWRGATLFTTGVQLNAAGTVDVPLAVVTLTFTGPPDPGGLMAWMWWASMKNTEANVEPNVTDVPFLTKSRPRM